MAKCCFRTCLWQTIFMAVWTLCATAEFKIPTVEIQALTPSGIRASIPDVTGIKLFGFHARVNTPINSKDAGFIEGDIVKAKNGRFVFENPNVVLKAGDDVYYWVFVQYNNLGYRLENQLFKVKALVSPNTPWSSTPGGTGVAQPVTPRPNCQPSITTINDGKPTCRGQLLFEESFNLELNPQRWVVEHRLPADDQEHEFVSYQKSRVTVAGSNLRISPGLLKDQPDYDENAEILNLTNGCTASNPAFCSFEAEDFNIIPPVVSGKISTRDLFSFKYGKVEIRARLPQGKWIYPALYLEPQRTNKYGMTAYQSGLMRIAFSRGNLDVTTADNSKLQGGGVLDVFECRSVAMSAPYAAPAGTNWGDAFHVYGFIWNADSFTLQVDGNTYASVKATDAGFRSQVSQCPSLSQVVQRWAKGTPMAPFDQEFYISLGVGVGGIADFPDNQGDKPWRNKGAKSKLNFIESSDRWLSTWTSDRKTLLVDSVKVWAL